MSGELLVNAGLKGWNVYHCFAAPSAAPQNLSNGSCDPARKVWMLSFRFKIVNIFKFVDVKLAIETINS